MTWIVGTPYGFGYDVGISDVRVTVGSQTSSYFPLDALRPSSAWEGIRGNLYAERDQAKAARQAVFR
jgi:N-acetylneuraminic acid mutarotase